MDVDPGLRAELTEVLGSGLVTSPDACVAFECDALTAHRHRPDLVALPVSVEQVQSVLRVCHGRNVPVVARGAGTGLSGGALPVAGGVLLVLSRLDRILDVDAMRGLARVQPGVTMVRKKPHATRFRTPSYRTASPG